MQEIFHSSLHGVARFLQENWHFNRDAVTFYIYFSFRTSGHISAVIQKIVKGSQNFQSIRDTYLPVWSVTQPHSLN